MPATEIITIINNSGKVISTGKHLVNIFKEAQAAYKDRKDAVKAERSAVRRAKTFDVSHRGDPYYDNYPYPRHANDNDHVYDRRALTDDGFGRGLARDYYDDSRSYASSRHSRRSRRPRSAERPFPALTEGNLKTHSEVSATTPSRAYRSPYAETAPRDMQVSRPTLAIGPPPQMARSDFAPQAGPVVLAPPPEQTQLVRRPVLEAPVLAKRKSIDMNLAYGDVPPDLESRVDLDRSEPEDPEKAQAMTLMDRIEDFLEEAHCVQHTASSMIESLQRNPQAAAAVALSLAELSTLVGKMSPAFLGFLKGGSPAVFALLASPQFLIGAGVAVGVTVVMFGGWKIVKRATAAKTLEAPLEMRVLPSLPPPTTVAPKRALPPPPPAGGSAAEYDEALVLRDVEELSSIESWRRGIVASEDAESADVELMSRQAERALKEQYEEEEEEEDEDYFDEVRPSDSVSQVSWARTDRTRRTHRTHKTSSMRHQLNPDDDPEVPERKSSKKPKDDGASVAASERSHRSKKPKDDGASVAASERSHRSKKPKDDGASVAASEKSHRSKKAKDDGASVAGSERSTRSHRSTKSHRHEGSTVSRSSKRLTAIEEGDGEDSGSTASKQTKEKKRDMIKQLFKMKKDKEDREKAHSVMV